VAMEGKAIDEVVPLLFWMKRMRTCLKNITPNSGLDRFVECWFIRIGR